METTHSQKVFAVLIFFIWIILILYGRNQEKGSEYKRPRPYRNVKKDNLRHDKKFIETKKILYYTPYFTLTDFEFGFGQEPFKELNCPVTNCYATNDRNLLRKILPL